MKVGRNDPCPCGSGLKYKHCCIDKRPEAVAVVERADSTEAATSAPRPRFSRDQALALGAVAVVLLAAGVAVVTDSPEHTVTALLAGLLGLGIAFVATLPRPA